MQNKAKTRVNIKLQELIHQEGLGKFKDTNFLPIRSPDFTFQELPKLKNSKPRRLGL